jgi:hypothetical protein
MVFPKQPDLSIFLGYRWLLTQVTTARSRILGDLECRVILYNRSKEKLKEKKKRNVIKEENEFTGAVIFSRKIAHSKGGSNYLAIKCSTLTDIFQYETEPL